MANNNTKRNNKLRRKAKEHFHGRACDTGFGAPANQRRSKHDYASVKGRIG